MPKAVATTETERLELKSLEGGWVELRRLTYGEKLKRRDMTAKMHQTGSDNKTYAQIDNYAVTMFEFSRTVVDHNLEGDNERKLNFKDPSDVERLDPRVAGEIEDKIMAMNEPPSPKSDGDVGTSSTESDTV
jgi:hypothetical protein